MYHLTQMWICIVLLASLASYVAGRRHGRAALQRQLRGDAQ